ncbi:MAG: hypothetical protein ACJAVV_003828 [Alphaproteobacteria bacterium]|jgi:hypothetical protein
MADFYAKLVSVFLDFVAIINPTANTAAIVI